MQGGGGGAEFFYIYIFFSPPDIPLKSLSLPTGGIWHSQKQKCMKENEWITILTILWCKCANSLSVTFRRLCSCCCFFRPVSLSTRNLPGRTRASKPRRGILLLLAPLAPSLLLHSHSLAMTAWILFQEREGKRNSGNGKEGLSQTDFLANLGGLSPIYVCVVTIVPVLFSVRRNKLLAYFFVKSTVKKL